MNPAWRELPVRSALPALSDALESGGVAVLAAPPGTGKTTLVPLALAGLLGTGPSLRVLVAEPRRLAVRAAARRMAWLLGSSVGREVGYTVRGERKVGPSTVVEVVTTGVLLQRLQRDQELTGVDVVVLDECHERHLDADTALAFLLDVRAALRPELRLVCASATSDTAAWAELLGGAPVVEAHGVSHPVEVEWAPPARAVRPAHGTRVDFALLDHVASVVRRALASHDGDVLCFLPGVGEIARVAGQLSDLPCDVLQLHGRAPQSVQDAALTPSTSRRVVLSTAVAESSLTVPGVRVVVDAGLAREPRTDHARGLSALVTVRASLAAARQRSGRAGREAPGTVYRCWHEAEDARAARFPTPEIALADLTSFALQAACWGDSDATGLALPDAPPAGAMAAARQTLLALGAVSADGRATPRGIRLARTGLHPRLGRALVDGAPAVGARRAAEIVALLSEEPPRALGDDLTAVWRAVRSSQDPYSSRWRDEVRRLERATSGEGITSLPDSTAAGLVIALAFPERIARARVEKPEPGERSPYLMASGTAADLAPDTRLGHHPWLAIAVADRPAGSPSARIRHAAAMDEDTARLAGAALLATRSEVRWDTRQGEVVSRQVDSLGAIELSSTPLNRPTPTLIRAALLEGLTREGVSSLLTFPTNLRERLAFLHTTLGAPWPDVSDEALLARADEWLDPELSRARRRSDLARIDTTAALQRLLPWSTGEAGRLDELAPERLTVPSGSKIRVDYGTDRPVLAAKVQELFGWTTTPTLAGGRVPVTIHLLSPAGRPAAVTSDLASFWQSGYKAVRADLRGRYPRHPWPEDPTTAEPTRRTNARK
ncbi:ATP-dependent helicase HrpB [Kitasatospora sp. NPDC101183]|uniref:ATP-dependent helicase HrpB n=1 Tax=Kitasatospora sp. NPDC101183 TaxID=3364100 RepID=UPI0038070E87